MSWTWPKAVIVHDLDQVRAALAAARALDRPVTLVSGAGAAGSIGLGFFATLIRTAKAEFPDVTAYGVVDCDKAAGRALAALRSGLDAVIYTGTGDSILHLADVAEELGVGLTDERPPALELLNLPDYEKACRDWLAS